MDEPMFVLVEWGDIRLKFLCSNGSEDEKIDMIYSAKMAICNELIWLAITCLMAIWHLWISLMLLFVSGAWCLVPATKLYLSKTPKHQILNTKHHHQHHKLMNRMRDRGKTISFETEHVHDTRHKTGVNICM